MKRSRKWELIAVVSSVLCSVLPITGALKAEAATPRIAGILSSKSTYWQEILQGIEDGCQKEGLSFFDIDIYYHLILLLIFSKKRKKIS